MNRAPKSRDEAVARLEATPIPEPIVEVARVLQEAGHAAVLVGGAVRDALLRREQGDWDLASSATPEEVMAAFRRTIPTGIEHGTVTVMVGPKDAREAVEVTTFRGEGAYLDGRRPSEVRYLRDLDEDLARRDFTINALAWDPLSCEFFDSFGGLEDMQRGLVRAVGVAQQRFEEDGLRTMRAVRFAAVLSFELDQSTEAAISTTLEVFDKVSRERVHVELFKLLKAAQPSLGLHPMLRTGLWERVLGEVSREGADLAIAAVDQLPIDVELRLARLLWPLRSAPKELDRVLDGVKPSRNSRKRVRALCSETCESLADALPDAVALRRAAAALGREHVDSARVLLRFDARDGEALDAALQGAALDVKELRVTAKELIGEGVLKPGPAVGEMMRALLASCLEDPSCNEPDQLRELAANWVQAQS